MNRYQLTTALEKIHHLNQRIPTNVSPAFNSLFIAEGAMQFRWYRRLDDLSTPGQAKLELVDERLLRAGDVGIVAPPPHDIHAFEVLEDDTWLVTAAPAPGLFTRQIYDLENDTYVERALETAVPLSA